MYDCIIFGAGPAGLAAAFAAVENGADTLLVESAGFVGGMSTEGMINVFCGDASCALYNDIYKKLIRRIGHRKVYDTEALKAYYLERIQAIRLRLLLHARFLDAKVAEGKIESVRILENAGIRELRARTYIDATGNGDVAYSCGVPFTLGRESDGVMQPVTVYVRIGGIDTPAYMEHVGNEREELQRKLTCAGERGELAPEACALRLIPDFHDGFINLNMTNSLNTDGTSSEELTRAELNCRAQIPAILRFIRGNVRGCANAFVVQTGAYAGIRESRHFHGAYTLHEDDLSAGRVFDDWCVSRADNQFNIHNLTGAGADRTSQECAKRYTIPFRSLEPQGISNLLLAGRNISGTHMAHGSYRVMPICMAMGQAAGTAAALITRNARDDFAALDIHALQTVLLEQGVEKPDDETVS
ncbi:MAG: FAD-dependent oxidoreductase [Eubacteriales bacterium]|jgi:hypothetical protein